MELTQIALASLGAVLILASLLPEVRGSAWWIRIFDFPRLQIALALLVVLAISLAVLDVSQPLVILLLAGEAAALAWQGLRLFPYTPLAPIQSVRAKSPAPRSCLRLLISNVLMDNRNAEGFLALVRAKDPDIVLAAEGDDWWDAQLGALKESHPHALRHPRADTYGLHLFSKLELVGPELRFLVEDQVPSFRTGIRLRSGAEIDFYGVHPSPPRPGQDTGQRDAELVLVGKEIKAKARPAVVAGDLNDVAWSHTTRLFQRLSGLLDPRIGRGLYSTFPARWPGMRWPLDHVFHDETFSLVRLERLPGFGSDHLPVLVELCHDPAVAAVQEAPQEQPQDQAEAADKIAEGRQGGR